MSANDIAIIGLSGRFPGARNVNEFWKNLRSGVESISFFTDEELISDGIDPSLFGMKNYVKAGTYIEEAESFDHAFFNINHKEAEYMDPQHRLFLEHAYNSLDDSGYIDNQHDAKIGVYASEFLNTYLLNNLYTNKHAVNYEYEKFMNSATFAKMNEKMIKLNGITTIGSMRAGSVYNQFSNKPLNTVADAKGVINRVAQMAPLVQCWKAYGAKPTSMDWGEIYTSLQTGVITAIDNPILDMYDEKFHEAIKYVNMTNNIYNMISYQTSMAFWNKLTDKEKAVFKKATKVASEKGAAEVKKRLDGVIAELKKQGKEFVQTDTSGFKKAIKDNIDTILAGNKDAIAVYNLIMKKEY